ncbi:MAG: DUF4266 domain-containing protein [Spirochaetaceae bacterium]|nr:DUF4266 domain-containing protein [Myxococcales bacterium]MCB9726476.1 DUF4266 domain-containing protein [Spirochaetaceae bacterium]HPG24759.1 DUF4266 domain-containing protein [Myxococcota bacterium]
MTSRLVLACVLAGVALASTGCVRVKPWERDLLARRDMAFEPDALEAKRESHIYFSKEASMPGGSGGGGGCGCN